MPRVELTVFARRDLRVFFEDARKMALRGEARTGGDRRERLVGITEPAFCLVRYHRAPHSREMRASAAPHRCSPLALSGEDDPLCFVPNKAVKMEEQGDIITDVLVCFENLVAADHDRIPGRETPRHGKSACACEWIFSEMCGIRVAGENRFEIAPQIGGILAYASLVYRSTHGAVCCAPEITTPYCRKRACAKICFDVCFLVVEFYENDVDLFYISYLKILNIVFYV